MHPAPQVQYPLTLQEPSCCIVRTLSILTNVVAIPDISLSRRVDFVIGVSGRSMEDTRHFRYTDKMEFHVIELPKLPVKESYTKLELWAKFINAEEKEEFDMIAEKDPYIDSAYRQLQIISQDEQMRMEYEAREKAMRDYNEMMYEADMRGEERGEKRATLRINKLIALLSQDKRYADLARSAADPVFQKQLMNEYGIK